MPPRQQNRIKKAFQAYRSSAGSYKTGSTLVEKCLRGAAPQWA